MSKTTLLQTILLVLCLLVSPQAVYADVYTTVFKSQSKLAASGNRLAQYKLGNLYEMGIGTDIDINAAKNWYGKAANSGSTAAKNRLIYLEVLISGYKPTQHNKWLKTIKKGTAANNVDATLLLGQLYRHGIGVNKDLHRALALFDQTGALGNSMIDREVAAAKIELETQQAKTKAKQDRKTAQPKKHSQQTTAAVKNKPSRAQLQAEKRRRYEAAMKKIKQEAAELEAQQRWAESQ